MNKHNEQFAETLAALNARANSFAEEETDK